MVGVLGATGDGNNTPYARNDTWYKPMILSVAVFRWVKHLLLEHVCYIMMFPTDMYFQTFRPNF